MKNMKILALLVSLLITITGAFADIPTVKSYMETKRSYEQLKERVEEAISSESFSVFDISRFPESSQMKILDELRKKGWDAEIIHYMDGEELKISIPYSELI